METLKSRVEQENPPSHFYDLLELACFSDDREAVLATVRRAAKFLHQYQNHKTPEIVQRARSLQLLCGTAANTFSDLAKWQAYNTELMTRFREDFLNQKSIVDLKEWLRRECNVAPHRIDEVVTFVKSSLNHPSASTKNSIKPPPGDVNQSFPPYLANGIQERIQPAGEGANAISTAQMTNAQVESNGYELNTAESQIHTSATMTPPPSPWSQRSVATDSAATALVPTVGRLNPPKSISVTPPPLPLRPPRIVRSGDPARTAAVNSAGAQSPALMTNSAVTIPSLRPPALPRNRLSGRKQSILVLWCVTGVLFAVTMIGLICLVVMMVRHSFGKPHPDKVNAGTLKLTVRETAISTTSKTTSVTITIEA